MEHPENVRTILKQAQLSEKADLEPDQLAVATRIAEDPVGQYPSGKALGEMIMKGEGRASGARSKKRGSGKRVKGEMSMSEAAKQILSRARGPLHAKEVYARAAKQKLVATSGKTPEQTMAARLAVGAEKGDFVRTAPNTFTLPGKEKAAA